MLLTRWDMCATPDAGWLRDPHSGRDQCLEPIEASIQGVRFTALPIIHFGHDGMVIGEQYCRTAHVLVLPVESRPAARFHAATVY